MPPPMRPWLDKCNHFLSTKKWPAEIMTAFIFILLLLPPSKVPEESILKWIPHLDKVVHFFLFGTYAFILDRYRGFRLNTLSFKLRTSLIFCWVAIYGIALEGLQLVVGRDFSWMDWIADMTGCVLFLFLIRFQNDPVG